MLSMIFIEPAGILSNQTILLHKNTFSIYSD